LLSEVLDGFELPDYVAPILFLLMWFKILSYLTVFKPTRYLIKMIFEIINDIRTFLIILFTALFAYAQICYVIDKSNYEIAVAGGDEEATATSIESEIRSSYTLSLGELGEFGDFDQLKFVIFVMFSFLVPLVLMNMLIAIMSDSYARVQTNAVAADAKALAEML